MDVITANANPKVKYLNKLNKNAAFRKEEDVFVVEGIRMFRELPFKQVRQIYLSVSAYERYREELEQAGIEEHDDNVILLSDTVFAGISQTKSPQGLMAVLTRYHYNMDDLISVMDKKRTGATYLILESIQDPGNLGTIVRSAEAAGAAGLVIGGASCDIYNPKTVRSTMGAIFRVPFVYVENLPKEVRRLKEKGVVLYGAHLNGKELYQETLADNQAFLIGNEGNGLSESLASCADCLIKIPMEGQVESLNAAISATLLAYEAYRQRKK